MENTLIYSIKSTINKILLLYNNYKYESNHETKNPVLFSIKYFIISWAKERTRKIQLKQII
jgi:hypothetical protein